MSKRTFGKLKLRSGAVLVLALFLATARADSDSAESAFDLPPPNIDLPPSLSRKPLAQQLDQTLPLTANSLDSVSDHLASSKKPSTAEKEPVLTLFDLPFDETLNQELNEPEVADPKERVALKLHTTILLKGNTFFYVLETPLADDEYLFLKVSGYGDLIISFSEDATKTPDQSEAVTLAIDAIEQTSLIPFDKKSMNGGAKVLNLYADKANSLLKVTLERARSIPLSFNSGLKIISKFATDFRFLVKTEEDYKPEPSLRFQFIVSSSLDSQELKGGEKLEMYINKGAVFPTAQLFDAKSSGILGNGLIRTFTKGSPMFCEEKQCQYPVTVVAEGVDDFTMMPSLLPDKSEVDFKRVVTILEELEAGQSVEYNFMVADIRQSWLLTILPFEGSVELLVNENREPKDPADFKYRVHSTRKEELIITASEQDAAPESTDMKTFWVRFQNPDKKRPCTFSFRMKQVFQDIPMEVSENTSENGSLVPGEIVSLLLNKGHDLTSRIKLELRLELLSGSADMVLKNCFAGFEGCFIGPEDFALAEKEPEHTTSRFVRKSKFKEGSNTQYLAQIVECVGFSGSEGRDLANSPFPLSESCSFAIGIRSLEPKGGANTKFKFVAYGAGTLNEMPLSQATYLKLAPKAKERYQINIGRPAGPNERKVVKITAVSITGICQLYFSLTSQEPSMTNFNAMIGIHNAPSTTLKTQSFVEQITIPSKNETWADEYLYVGAESLSYCAVDVTPVVLLGEEQEEPIEEVTVNRLYHRQITEEAHPTGPEKENSPETSHYAKKFIFGLNRNTLNLGAGSDIHFLVDTQALGLTLCIQQAVDGKKGPDTCLFESKGTQLVVPRQKLFKNDSDKVIVSVQKRTTGGERAKLPIEFTLKISTDTDFEPTELTRPGYSHTSRLHRGVSQEFFVDLLSAQSIFTLLFESADSDMFADVSLKSERGTHHLARLNSDRFGLELRQLRKVRETNCTETLCNVVISVYSPSANNQRFTLTYQRDDVALTLKEGEQLAVPNNRPMLFVFDTDGKNPVAFSIHNEVVESTIYAKMVEAQFIFSPLDLIHQISSDKFDFKTSIETDPEVTIPASAVDHNNPPAVAFFVRPMFNVEQGTMEGPVMILGKRNRAVVHLHAKLLQIKPFYLGKYSVTAGDTRFFELTVDPVDDFSLVLTLFSGKAVLYLNRGDGNLPTPRKFWKKTTNLSGDEVVVAKEDILAAARGSTQFIVGVFGGEAASFSLLYLPAFKNLIKVRFQHLVDLAVESGKYYYFDYLNTHADYNTYLYAEGGDVEVSALHYDKFEADFVTMTTDETNYHQKFTIKKEDFPRRRAFSRPDDERQTTIVRMVAPKADARVAFAIYDEKKPLQVFTEKRFKFAQDANQTVVFEARLGGTYDEVEVHVRVEVGSATFSPSNVLSSFGAAHNVSMGEDKAIVFRITSATSASDITIFRRIYLRVESAEFSRYSVLLLPKDKFRQVRAFEPEIITTSAKKDIYVYFYLSPQMKKSVHSLTFEVIRPESFVDRPDMLFVAESDVILSGETPFLPMPLIDVTEKRTGEYIQFEIKPEAREGNYVLRFQQTETELPAKITVSYNDQRNIEVNSFHKGSIPARFGKSAEYSMFVPQKGEVRVLVESCSDLTVVTGRFQGEAELKPLSKDFDHNEYSYDAQTKITQVTFDQRFAQSSPFLLLRTTKYDHSAKLVDLTSRIVRLTVTEPGILKFKISRHAASSEKDLTQEGLEDALTDPTYSMLTEFRPLAIQLILKDYVQLFSSEDDLKSLRMGHRHAPDGNVYLTIRVPMFKPQLLVDYPGVNFASMKFSFYAFADPDFPDKLATCGTPALESIPHSLTVHTFNFTRAQISNSYFNNFVEVVINSTQLAVLQGARSLQVFCLLSVRWFNNQDEMNQISLDPKYTHVPYFFMSFPYRERSALPYFIAVGVLLSLLAYCVWIRCERRRARVVLKEYKPPGAGPATVVGERLEMSSISRSNWGDESL